MATFKESLSKSGKGVLDARAANLAEMTKIEADRQLSDYKAKVLRIKNQIANHEDLAVTSRDSLVVGGKDFESKAWVEKGIELEKQLRVAKIEYTLVKKWHDRLFPENEEAMELEEEVEDVNE